MPDNKHDTRVLGAPGFGSCYSIYTQ